LSNATLIAYNEGSLGAIESAQARDHLLLCPECRRAAAAFRLLDSILATPTLHTPPARLIPQVMERLYPALPRITSIAAMIAASVLFLITWIYIYFDFSSSSLIQALRLTTNGTSGWLADVIKAITAVYNGAQAAAKALSALLRIFLPTPLGAAVAASVFLALAGLLAAPLLRPWLKRARAKRT
jgi:predicted anti-sigma-YlaC factor YlaD